MGLVLDPATEQRLTQRIQREIELGHCQDAAEVITRALNLLEAQEEWLLTNKDAINQRLDESMAEIERGEGIPGDQLREVLASR